MLKPTLACVLALAVSASFQGDPAATLAAARAAMGGDAALANLTQVKLEGRMARFVGRNRVDASWTMTWDKPGSVIDQEVQAMDTPMGVRQITRRTGFVRDELISMTTGAFGASPPPPGPPQTVEQKEAARVRALAATRTEFLRWMLPLMASVEDVSSTVPLTLGTEDTVWFTGPDGVATRVEFDAATKLPSRVVWMGRPVAIMTTTSTVAVPSGQTPTAADLINRARPPVLPADPTAGKPDVEHQLVFGEFRAADGRTWPRVVTHRVAGEVFEEWRIQKHSVKR